MASKCATDQPDNCWGEQYNYLIAVQVARVQPISLAARLSSTITVPDGNTGAAGHAISSQVEQ
jgi:hypothetical protein